MRGRKGSIQKVIYMCKGSFLNYKAPQTDSVYPVQRGFCRGHWIVHRTNTETEENGQEFWTAESTLDHGHDQCCYKAITFTFKQAVRLLDSHYYDSMTKTSCHLFFSLSLLSGHAIVWASECIEHLMNMLFIPGYWGLVSFLLQGVKCNSSHAPSPTHPCPCTHTYTHIPTHTLFFISIENADFCVIFRFPSRMLSWVVELPWSNSEVSHLPILIVLLLERIRHWESLPSSILCLQQIEFHSTLSLVFQVSADGPETNYFYIFLQLLEAISNFP